MQQECSYNPKLTESLLVQSPQGEKADLEPKANQAESRSRNSNSHWEIKCDPRLIRYEHGRTNQRAVFIQVLLQKTRMHKQN